MFGRSKISEGDRLRAVYADQSDGELLRLDEEREGLTEAAREALAAVMKERGLAAGSHGFAVAAVHGAAEQVHTSATREQDEVILYTFDDTWQLREAARLLEEANIPLRLADESQSYGSGMKRHNLLYVDLLVRRWDEAEAKKILQQRLGVFAGNEVPGAPDFNVESPTALELLLMCNRLQAIEVAKVLCDTGVSFFWRDGREDKDLPDPETVAVEVHASQHSRADRAIQEWMSRQPEQDPGA